MSSSVEAHVRYKIANAPVLDYPFPHFHIRDIFPEDFYTTLRQHLPDEDFFSRNTRAIAVPGDEYKERSICSLKDLENDGADAESSDFWSSISTWMLSYKFAMLIAEKFEDAIYGRFGTLGKNEIRSEARMVMDRKNYAIGPHTDAPQKLVSLLFYLPGDERLSHLGTSIYVPDDPDFTCPGGPHYRFDGFTKAATMPFVPNSLLAFAKTDRSFHGVEPIQDEGIKRHVLLYNLYANKVVSVTSASQQVENRGGAIKRWWRKP